MNIKPINTVINADNVLNLLGKDFNFDHSKGIAELIKNSVDAYNVEKVPDEKQIILISVITNNTDYIKELMVVDFCGMTKNKIDNGFIHWFSNVSASLSKDGSQTNLKTLGGHGNGGKFYMRQMFKESQLITYLNKKLNIFGFNERKQYGYLEGFENVTISPDKAIEKSGLSKLKAPPKLIESIISGKNGFSIIRGIHPVKSKDTNYRLKLAEKIISNPQSLRIIKHKKVYFQSLPDLTWTQLPVPPIPPRTNFENPIEFTCPDVIELFNEKISMTNKKYPNNIKLILYTSQNPLIGAKDKDLNRIDFLSDIGVIASYNINNLGAFSTSYPEFIYGECFCPILEDEDEDYVKNDRIEFVQGDRSNALLKWVQECVENLSKQIDENQKQHKRKEDLKESSNFNQILNTWNRQFLKTFLKEQLFGDQDLKGVGGSSSDSPVLGDKIGKRSGKKAKKSIGTKGGTEKKKAPIFPQVLISSYDKDPLSETGSSIDCDPRHPAVYQRLIDKEYGIHWVNTSKQLAKLILEKYSAESPQWRNYLFQRHVDIIINETIFQISKREVSLDPHVLTTEIHNRISEVLDKAATDLFDFLLNEKYKL